MSKFTWALPQYVVINPTLSCREVKLGSLITSDNVIHQSEPINICFTIRWLEWSNYSTSMNYECKGEEEQGRRPSRSRRIKNQDEIIKIVFIVLIYITKTGSLVISYWTIKPIPQTWARRLSVGRVLSLS